MSGLFPEQPVLFYPSLAARYGTEEAVLLAVYHDFARHHGAADSHGQSYFLARRHEWQHLVSFWDEDRLAEITGSLVAQGVIDAEFNPNGSIRVTILEAAAGGRSAAATGVERDKAGCRSDLSATTEQRPGSGMVAPAAGAGEHTEVAASEGGGYAASATPMADTESAVAEPAAPRVRERQAQQVAAPGAVAKRAADESPGPALPEPSGAWQAVRQHSRSAPVADASMLPRGPAPSFGGSVGWSRPKDELEMLFDKQEKRNQQLQEMLPDWQPNSTTRQLLKKQNISDEFADSLIDEFVSYWSMRDRKEASWDHLFIRLVKKQWVREQTRQGRSARNADQRSSEVQGERYQPNNRAEKRERITRQVMDINNVDW